MVRSKNDNDFARPKKFRRNGRRWPRLLLILMIGLLIVVGALPAILSNRSIVVSLANQYGGIAPLKLDIKSVSAGWFKSIGAEGIELSDESGNVLVRVNKVVTDKGVLNWILNSSDIGRIQVSGVEAIVVAKDGTTNIEQALAPVLQSEQGEDDDTATSSDLLTGTIEVSESKFLFMESGNPKQWVVEIPTASMVLPSAEQVIGATELSARIGEVSGAVETGRIDAKIQQVAGSASLDVKASLSQLPLGFWHVARARLPELPVEQMEGYVTATLAGRVATAENWSVDIEQIESRSVRIVAPELVGEDPAKLELLVARGRASLDGQSMRVDGAQVQCDFANAAASVHIPWPMEFPTATKPFLDNATFDVRGTVDIPKMVDAASTLIPMREDTQLVGGTGQFVLLQTSESDGIPRTRANISLSGLEAVAGGQPMSWQEPLSVDLQLEDGSNGPQFIASASAEFCSLQGNGNIESGRVTASLDLQKLHQRLVDWVEIPVNAMSGAAQADLHWELEGAETLKAHGTLNTTPVVIAASTGTQHSEPAWSGTLAATTILVDGTPERIMNASLQLASTDEQLTVELQDPMLLTPASKGGAKLVPAGFVVNLKGDLEKWNRRGTMWLSEPPELAVAGNAQIAVAGRMDLSHVEISTANWRCEPLSVATAGLTFSEPLMIGSFKGLVNSSDLGQLAVQDLKLQMSSLSLAARDSAAGDALGSRKGEAGFQVDLQRLSQNFSSGTIAARTSTVESDGPSSQTLAAGLVRGQLAWHVNSTAAGVSVGANAEQFSLASYDPATGTTSPLWSEPTVNVALNGQWLAETGDARVENLQVKMPWATYNGSLQYDAGTAAAIANPGQPSGGSQTNLPKSVEPHGVQSLAMKGQVVYDSATLSQRLVPYTGGQVQLVGQQTVPIDLNWVSSAEPNSSMLAGLHAKTRIGWQQARVAGIDVGVADVPVSIQSGHLTSATEIPVSGGVLRWDIESDLTSEQMVIHQKPMTVLENVAITDEMCKGWLKYVAPLLAEATKVDGRLSLGLAHAELSPANPSEQTVRGQLFLHDAQVGPGPLSSQLIAIVKQVESIRKNEFSLASTSGHVWLKVPEQKIDFEMVDGRVSHRNLNVRIGDADISTSGTVGVDGQMDLLASMPVPDNWIEKAPVLESMRGQSLQFPMRGSLTQPQVDTAFLQQFGRQAVQSAAQGLLQQQLSKGLGKLFGEPILPQTGK